MTTPHNRWDDNVPATLGQGSTAANPTNHVPPDWEVDATRKTRVNNELLDLLNQPRLPRTTASIQGVGLYTHAAIPQSSGVTDAQRSTNPIFLPIGGPKKVLKDESVPAAPISDDVLKVWKEVQQAVNEEEQHSSIRQGRLNAEQLKVRYGGLDAPQESAATVAQPAEQQRSRRQALREYSRRSSSGEGPSGDAVMGGTEPETKRAAAHTDPSMNFHRGATTGPRTNLYDAGRDPRKR
ncbi:hypothetical protein BDU57DRAFT_444051 [Ampelomyces quisqualis]|uniref:Uncharacterized protein n=1 Tax=Ampelomyces quisqualis TaxID=50730 RepID=A0A6A5QRD6_AMPQU|nr:hypothetical protein BDU57DRAFT_444051 [Ampelomyces quisqualis]